MTTFKKTKLKQLFEVSSIVTILYFEYSKDFYFPGESHNFWELLYIDKGELTITADTTSYLLKAGEMFFHKPNEFHNLKAMGKIAPNASIISFYCDSKKISFFKNKIIKLNQTEKNFLSIITEESLTCFKSLSPKPPIYGMKRLSSNTACSEHIIKNYLELLLLNIYKRNGGILKNKRIVHHENTELQAGLKAEIIKYLNDNIEKNLKLSDIAQALCVSVSKLKKTFSQSYGHGVIDHFINLKIKKAKEMIRQDNYNFTEISERLGFNSLHYFSRKFKQLTGMTPTEYSNSIKISKIV